MLCNAICLRDANFFEEEGGENYCSDNAESSSHEEDETPQKSDGVVPREK